MKNLTDIQRTEGHVVYNLKNASEESNVGITSELNINRKIGMANSHLVHIVTWGISALHRPQRRDVSQVQKFLRRVIEIPDLIERGECSKEEVEAFGRFMGYQGYHYRNKPIGEQKEVVNEAVQQIRLGIEDLQSLKKRPKEFYSSSTAYYRVEGICKKMCPFFRSYEFS
jgi:hypothetical protein